MQHSSTNDASKKTIVTHPLDPDDATPIAALRATVLPFKGMLSGAGAREPFNAIMERVSPRSDVTFERGTVGGITGVWVHPTSPRSDEAILHLHGGWVNFGAAWPYRHLVGHIAARAGSRAFIPDYRLAPEHPFPAAADDVLACYRGLEETGIRRIALAGDSAGGNLALGLASRVTNEAGAIGPTTLVGVVALSPVTDLTLSGETYQTRADADPLFTRPQVAALVQAYLRNADPTDPAASPLFSRLTGLPGIRIHVGDDEVLLDDSRRYVERAVSAGVDARLDVWMGMLHGFSDSVGRVKASAQALDAVGEFLSDKLRSRTES